MDTRWTRGVSHSTTGRSSSSRCAQTEMVKATELWPSQTETCFLFRPCSVQRSVPQVCRKICQPSPFASVTPKCRQILERDQSSRRAARPRPLRGDLRPAVHSPMVRPLTFVHFSRDGRACTPCSSLCCLDRGRIRPRCGAHTPPSPPERYGPGDHDGARRSCGRVARRLSGTRRPDGPRHRG